MEGAVRALLVRLGGRTFAVDARAVRGVVVPESVTPVPRAHDWLLGLLAVRGGIVPLVDLAALLELPAGAGAQVGLSARAVVVDGGEAFAFPVDDVLGFAALEEGAPPHLVVGAPTLLSGHPTEQRAQAVNPERVVWAFSQQFARR